MRDVREFLPRFDFQPLEVPYGFQETAIEPELPEASFLGPVFATATYRDSVIGTDRNSRVVTEKDLEIGSIYDSTADSQEDRKEARRSLRVATKETLVFGTERVRDSSTQRKSQAESSLDLNLVSPPIQIYCTGSEI